MSYAVKWSRSEEAAAQIANGTPNVFVAMQGEKEAIEFARQSLRRGDIVWAIEDDSQRVIAEGEAVRQMVTGDGPITSGG